ncbi:hypothetical protein [Sphingomonas sp. PAMC 26605]|uniref:hypothetical protein n=1 Tax=Sphingomonas sp. PAMC 26605 TaxID=1112214 RepID=UPI00026CCFCB|nr:hypothetical protein [Sphingomonas sp. PAMC 26605]
MWRERRSPEPDCSDLHRSDYTRLDLGPDTIKYLGDLAAESFKRQSELDESVWRSLPFFAAIFAFVATIVGKSAVDAPAWNGTYYTAATITLLSAATLSMAWTLRWFWVVLRPREYEYPAPDFAIRDYAEQITEYHAESGVPPGDLDAKTLTDVRLFMIDQYGSAAATNLTHNAAKLKARTKVLLFMLLGFVLAFACEATIFVHTHIAGAGAARGAPTDVTSTTLGTIERFGKAKPAAASGSAEITIGDRRRKLLGHEFEAANPEQAMTRGRNPISPNKPAVTP